jgi:hypothetical protein
LPSSNILQKNAVARVFKKAIAYDGISGSDFEDKDEGSREALEKIWRNGWLHAEQLNNGTSYVFASKIHRW